MGKFILRRLLLTLVVLLGVTFIVFLILSLTPGTPGQMVLGPTAPQEAIEQLNHEFGYDQPFFTRFFNYVKNIVLHFDFGVSYRTNQKVFDEIMSRFPVTLTLALVSVFFSCLIGITLGVISAVKQYSWLDNLCSVTAMFFASVPGFWLGMVLILIFSLYLNWLPAYGVAGWKNYIMPSATLIISGSASFLRLTRSSMLETIRQDYVRTAKAKGANIMTVIVKHALKNALLPIITAVGMQFGHLLGGAVVCEIVFAMPGLGTLIVTSIRNKDIPQVMAAVIFLAALFCLIMMVVDLIQAFLDPRIKARYAGGKAK